MPFKQRNNNLIVCRQLLFMVHDLLPAEGKIAALKKKGGRKIRKKSMEILLFDEVEIDVVDIDEM
jgi:hypothetical protein